MSLAPCAAWRIAAAIPVSMNLVQGIEDHFLEQWHQKLHQK